MPLPRLSPVYALLLFFGFFPVCRERCHLFELNVLKKNRLNGFVTEGFCSNLNLIHLDDLIRFMLFSFFLLLLANDETHPV